jgi:hypothetical protein
MNDTRAAALVATLVLTLTTAACGGSPPTGVLTGTLQRCTLHVQTETVQVIGTNGGVVATQRVTEGHIYRFVLPPGRYFISTGGPLDKAHPVVLEKAGQTVYQSFPPYVCY